MEKRAIPWRRSASISAFVVGLPDFRNRGVLLRALVIAEGANLLAWFAHAERASLDVLTTPAPNILFELSLLAVVLVLYVVAPWLGRLAYPLGGAAVVGIATAVPAGLDAVANIGFIAAQTPGPLKAGVIGGVLAAVLLMYFDWRQRVLAPSLVESRLMALQARIRPHFLFNCLNTAVAVLRERPQLAEKALLDLADLFRAALVDKGQLVPLADEVQLALAYLDIESLRLADRLRVVWNCEAPALESGVPSMLLQPLLENAVHHGVERCEQGGAIEVCIKERAGRLEIAVSNPLPQIDAGFVQQHGNRVALGNISERLALLFDAEAELKAEAAAGRFIVRIRLPFKRIASTGASGQQAG